KSKKPVHRWPLADLRKITDWHINGILVEEFMTTDLFTVHKGDIPELLADIMDWQKIRFIPVEDKKGKLVGLVSMNILMRYFSEQSKSGIHENKTVDDLMIKNPVTISPESTIFEAMVLLREGDVGCLPVVKNDKLVGIISEGNFLSITRTLLKVLDEQKSDKLKKENE
ncbi:MAG: CBS domain-containing protein, partial [Cyclobacteriaceae bacterium]|nr:CBS domain-containing protein [Cyclobacteriaceae bacterium]